MTLSSKSIGNQHKYICKQEDSGKRVDAIIAAQHQIPSRSYAQKMIDNKLVEVNGIKVDKSYYLSEGDIIIFQALPIKEVTIKPQDINVQIIFEDKDIAVVSKPAGIVTHPAVGNWDNTLVNALLFHLKDLSGIGGELRAGIIHRLDKDTSGIMLIAKNDIAHQRLSLMFKERTVKKTYLALVHGKFDFKEGIIDAPIARSPKNRKKMAVVEGGKDSVTKFKVKEAFNKYSLVEASPLTGRTHQIRVHFAYIKHPVVGDSVYGYQRDKKDLGMDRQFLHAYRLEFKHPVSDKLMIFEDSLADDLRSILLQI